MFRKPRGHILVAAILAGLIATLPVAAETANVTVDPGKTWLGFMNVFELGGNYLWGNPWGAGDLPAVFSGPRLTLSPNTNTYNPADPYWVNPDGSGNKLMEANYYVEDTGLIGKTVHFRGLALSNTLANGYTAQAFIKVLDSGANWALVGQAYAPLVGGQVFDLSLAVGDGATLVPQYGFLTRGPNANPATVAALGSAVVIPEPCGLALLAIGAVLLRRHR